MPMTYLPDPDCGACDGVGWFEGGPTLKTNCTCLRRCDKSEAEEAVETLGEWRSLYKALKEGTRKAVALQEPHGDLYVGWVAKRSEAIEFNSQQSLDLVRAGINRRMLPDQVPPEPCPVTRRAGKIGRVIRIVRRILDAGF